MSRHVAFCSVVLFSLAFQSSLLAQSEISIPTNITAGCGEVVTIPVQISDVGGVAAFDFELNFDPDILEVLAVGLGDALPVAGEHDLFLANFAGENGKVFAAFFFLETLAAGGGTLLEIDFQVAATAPAGMTLLDLTVLSLNEGQIDTDPIPEDGPDESDGALMVNVPDIALTPTSLDFNDVLVGESATLGVTVENTGQGILVLQDFSLLAGSHGDFTISLNPGAVDLATAETTTVEVTFAPTAGEPAMVTGALEIRSKDCDESLLTVALTGQVQTGSLFKRGDSNSDGGVDISDASYSLNYLFIGGPRPSCDDGADANDDRNFDISDPVYLLNYLFSGGPPPPDPGPDTCGADPTEDSLPICEDPDDKACP